MKSRYFRRPDNTWLDTVMTTAADFTTDGRVQADQLGSRLEVIEVEDGPDPRDVVVPIVPDPPPPPTKKEIFMAELRVATTLAQLKSALIKVNGG